MHHCFVIILSVIIDVNNNLFHNIRGHITKDIEVQN